VDLSGAGNATARASIFAGADPETVSGVTATALYRMDNDAGADAKGSFDLTAVNSPTAQNNLLVLRDQVGTYHLRATTSAPTWSASAFSNRGGAVFTAASSQFLVHEAAPVTAAPFQVYAVAMSTSATASTGVVWLGDKDVATDHWRLAMSGNTGGDPVGFSALDTSTADTTTSTGYTANTTHLLWGMETSNVSRAVRIDGGSEGTNTTDLSPDGSDRVAIGGFLDSTPTNFHGGDIGAVWLKDSTDVTDRADAHEWVETQFGLTLP
jgi:hypothetical protein